MFIVFFKLFYGEGLLYRQTAGTPVFTFGLQSQSEQSLLRYSLSTHINHLPQEVGFVPREYIKLLRRYYDSGNRLSQALK